MAAPGAFVARGRDGSGADLRNRPRATAIDPSAVCRAEQHAPWHVPRVARCAKGNLSKRRSSALLGCLLSDVSRWPAVGLAPPAGRATRSDARASPTHPGERSSFAAVVGAGAADPARVTVGAV